MFKSREEFEEALAKCNEGMEEELEKARDPFSDFPSKAKESAVDKKSREITSSMRERAGAKGKLEAEVKKGKDNYTFSHIAKQSGGNGKYTHHTFAIYHKGEHIGGGTAIHGNDPGRPNTVEHQPKKTWANGNEGHNIDNINKELKSHLDDNVEKYRSMKQHKVPGIDRGH